ncbi:hypothetical protein SNE40_008845 [Patella caerulea]|uniref:Uncharacterized protein n=1 Tax=Patella caerulea TaxID=87958 RepID=A0AAN8Q278_PATCE
MSKKINGNKDDTIDVNSLELLDLAIQRYEAETLSRFVCIKKEKLFGKENEIDISSLKSVNIRFQDTQTNTCPFIKYDGVPFVIIGKKILECHQGKDRDIKKKVQARLRKDLFSKSDHNFCKVRGTLSRESKKKSCPARIFARHVIKFPDFKFGKKPSQSRESISNAIKKILKNGDALSYQHKYYVSFASADNHQYHFKEREPVPSTRIDAQLASFIETMVHFHGVSSCRTIQPLLEVFLREIMFPGKPLPPKSNKKFWPSSNDISSYMALAVMKQGVTNGNRVNMFQLLSATQLNCFTFINIQNIRLAEYMTNIEIILLAENMFNIKKI